MTLANNLLGAIFQAIFFSMNENPIHVYTKTGFQDE